LKSLFHYRSHLPSAKGLETPSPYSKSRPPPRKAAFSFIAFQFPIRYLPGMEASPPKKDRSHWVVKKFTSFDEQRTWQVKEWQKRSGADRRKAAWELVYDYWVGMKGMKPDELRLQRIITNVQRPRS
jgi:hypothetical protein